MYSRTPYTLDRVVRLVISIVLVLAALWLINILKDVLLPFLVSCLIAYMFEPLVQHNRKLLKLRKRRGAVFITLFEVTLLFGILCWFFIPMLFNEIHEMANVLRKYAESNATVRFLPSEIHVWLRRNVDFNHIANILTKQEWAQFVDDAIQTLWAIITGSVGIIISVVSWLVVIIYVVFIMLDYERLGAGIRHMVPPRFRKMTFKIGNDVKRSMNRYFRGQALVAFIVGILFAIGFSIIGLPMAIMLGLFIGILNLVPYLQLISFIPTTLLCLVYAAGTGADFWTIFAESIAVYCIVQGIQDLYLTPRIMGKAMGLNPAIILLSLSVWGSLLGLVGLIIALPLTTLLIAYYDEYIIHRETTGNEPPAQAKADLKAIDRALNE